MDIRWLAGGGVVLLAVAVVILAHIKDHLSRIEEILERKFPDPDDDLADLLGE